MYKSINILQFGVGGTGSYLVLPLHKFLQSLSNTNNYKNGIKYYLIDDDIVEDKNIARQNFLFNDINSKKSEAMKMLYNNGYSDAIIESIDTRITNQNYNIFHNLMNYKDSINLVIGCVDNVDSRINIAKMIEEYINKYVASFQQIIYYIDSGNLINSGQVLVFDYNDDKINNTINTKKILEIFDNEETRKLDNTHHSCNDNGDQSIMANFQAASILYNVITEIITIKNTTIKKIAFMRYYRDIDCDNAIQLKNAML